MRSDRRETWQSLDCFAIARNDLYHRALLSNVRMMRTLRVLILCLLVSGCGYQNVSRTSFPGSVYFSVLTNRTMQPGIEVTLTNVITEELLRSGLCLTKKKTAEYLLSGLITSYQRAALSFSPDDPKEVSQYRLTVTIHLKLQESMNPPSPPFTVDITAFTDYYRVGPFAKSEGEAFGVIADDLAKRTTEWLTEVATGVQSVIPAARKPESGV